MELARQEVIQEHATTAKRVMYPIWTIAIIVNSLLLIGYYYQDELIKRNAKKLRAIERNEANRL